MIPPIRKLKSQPNAITSGVRNQSFPCHSVPMIERKMTPVGIEMASVRIMNGAWRKSAMPDVNMWCAHTTTDKPTIVSREPTTALYANKGFLEKAVAISRITPNPGRTMMYTAGCE